MIDSLYVHIPFCKRICFYCDFCKMYYHQPWVMPYLEALDQELIQRQAKRPFKTVYIGGGSPSALSVEELQVLFQILQQPLSEAIEATIEVNPEDLTLAKAQLFKKAGIQRVSLGVQTFNDQLLKKVGRSHQLSTIKQAVRFLKEVGIDNISFDFIYGLPDQTLTDVENDLNILSTFPEVTHCSFYSLILEEHTIFSYQGITTKDDEWLVEAMVLIHEKLNVMGFSRYEVSNYCKPGYSSKHNLVYWHNEHYIGVGLGASGYIGHERYDNTRSLQKYLHFQVTYQTTLLSIEDEMFEEVMLGLRLVDGLSLQLFKNKYHKALLDVYPKLYDYINLHYLSIENDDLKPTALGLDLLDEILLGLMD